MLEKISSVREIEILTIRDPSAGPLARRLVGTGFSGHLPILNPGGILRILTFLVLLSARSSIARRDDFEDILI
jgi:hypothetical protein